MQNEKIILTTVNNNPHYMEGLCVWLKSLAKNAPGEKVLVHLVNCDDAFGDRLRGILASVTIRHWPIPDLHIPDIIHRQSLYCKLAMEEGYGKVAWIDNDAIIRAPLDSFWKDCVENSLKIVYRPDKKDKRKFQGGIFVVGNGEHTLKYISEWEAVREKYLDSWYGCQEQQYLIWKKNHNVTLVRMEDIHNDSKFHRKSVIWHCKQEGFKHSSYQKEYKWYLSL